MEAPPDDESEGLDDELLSTHKKEVARLTEVGPLLACER
jgi:hypothetical protein